MIISNTQKKRIKSAEEREKIASSKRKNVLNFQTGKLFLSIKECASYYNKSACHMTRLIKKGKFDLMFI